ncbi:fimbria/pilus outer membrane usher protein [Lelliottia sp. CFBP8978]|jgi:outer membrane usher protein|uniref:fimbria/pilus outer membrane usher protein n=1 Tax=Lelliottia sp. CFBP8978 TaxID=3096522 RepID=UPI002A6ABA3E|nr:fimbria/pilus outer membrane usher protein [Lelliottia sp. CFBP8978]MDY1038554.1 fimbria/pilus outer membrane usher protein [Lelliottia sp. CFBP8978]
MKYKVILKHALLATLIAQILTGVAQADPKEGEMYFNPALLETDNSQQGKTDLSVFAGDTQAPGTYRVDIYVNKDKVDSRDIEFTLTKDADDKSSLQPCLSVSDLKKYGVRTEIFPGLNTESGCANLSAIPQATSELTFSTMQLDLSIPQAALTPRARGYVPPEQWDNGITAFLLNYSLSGDSSTSRTQNGSDSNSQYANLRPGLNIGPWRLRNYSTWSRDNSGQQEWSSVYTYLQRNVVPLKSELTLGDSSSPSDVFDSISFHGVQIASDDDMQPDSLRGYAPVVRGIARTNAQVIIRQNGYQIYQSYVAPGAFEITDMYPTGGSGDLDVTIKESDGSEQHLIVPFASLPVLQREGRFKYSVTGGKYRAYDDSTIEMPFVQGTAMYGLPWGITAYGGLQSAKTYRSVALGLGFNIGTFGAFSIDGTQARSTPFEAEEQSGQSWRVRYSKSIAQTGTSVSVAGYRYSTDGYYSMQDVFDTYSDDHALPSHNRSRQELTLSQNLGKNAGSLSANVVAEDYWDSNQTMKSISLGYNNSWHDISYSINYSYNRNTSSSGNDDVTYDHDQVVTLNISVPLDHFLPNTYASYGLNTSQQGSTSHNVSLNGTALPDNNLSWGLQEGYTSEGEGNNGSLSANYRGTYGQANAGYSYDENSRRMSYGLSGGVVAHENGITLSQPLGETIALVKAPGASGVGVNNQTGVKTDYRGYAVQTFLSPYRKNDISLNTETLPDNVDIALANKTVVPTRGAVVRADFQARVGSRVLMTLLKMGGEEVPFGATVTDPTSPDAQGFIVGDAGQVFLTGLRQHGTLNVQWGQDTNEHCQVDYSLPDSEPQNGIMLVSQQCK